MQTRCFVLLRFFDRVAILVCMRLNDFHQENVMTATRHPTKPGHTNKTEKNDEPMLDEALDETFPASDPIAVHPDACEADAAEGHLKTQQPLASRSRGGPTTPPRR